MMDSIKYMAVDPCWQASDLGQRIPRDPHAVSVALPRWEDVVGYEERTPAVLSRLVSGYPRFVVHPLVREMGRVISGREGALPFPSGHAAEACLTFIRREGFSGEISTRRGYSAVSVAPGSEEALKAFWQHTGLIVTSREAEHFLGEKATPGYADAVRQGLREQVSRWYGCGPEDVWLFPSGMGAIYAALLAVGFHRPGLPTLQIGFPYVDTLKLQERFGSGARFFHNPTEGERTIASGKGLDAYAGCFCEIPGNPLLGCPDITRMQPALHAAGVPLVVDDVVATPVNVDVTDYADLMVTSLTKFWAGTGDVMGGALIVNVRSPFYPRLREAAKRAAWCSGLWAGDAEVLVDRVAGFGDRMARHNANGLALAERLREHPAVERVWYPKWECGEAYDAVRRPGGGWGGLLAVLVRDAERHAATVYDQLRICKGPSLGTVFTLACPFTLLAHYRELDWAEGCGVSRHLIRISVGLEDPEEIWERIRPALDAVSAGNGC